MRRILAVAVVLTIAGCGLDLVIDATPAPTPTSSSSPADARPPNADAGLDGGANANANADAEANDAEADAQAVDATIDASDGSTGPDPTKVVLSYAGGKNRTVYSFNYTTATFTALKSNGCPAIEETAVLADGTVYVTSDNDAELFKWTAAAGCTRVANNLALPYALGTAPFAGIDELVGYRNGDYLKVDRTTGVVSTLNAGALGALRPSGDVTRIGLKGYLAAQTGQGTCPFGGDCVVEVNLANGTPIGAPTQFSGLSILGIAHSGGMLLLFVANGQVIPLNPTTMTLGAVLATSPVGANFSGAGAPAFPVP